MIQKLLKNPRFRPLANRHTEEMILFLLDEGIEFGIICDASHASFEPILPEELAGVLLGTTLFVLGGYSFESAHLHEGKLLFEAGFGPNNFASLVTVPVEAIIQLVIDETVIHLNIAATLLPKLPKGTLIGSEHHSRQSFFDNPENEKFFRR